MAEAQSRDAVHLGDEVVERVAAVGIASEGESRATEAQDEPVRDRKPGFFAPLRHKNFRRLLLGQTISRLGDSFYFIALPWLVLRGSSSPIALSLVLGTAAATLGIFTLIGGVLADRYGPRLLMLFSDVLRLVVVAGLAAIALLGAPPLWLLVAVAALLGVGGGLFYPASAAMIPHLMSGDELQSANAFDQMTMQTSNFVGPSAAGVVLAATRLAFGFVIDALSFVVSLVTLMLIRMPAKSVAATASATTVHEGAKPAGGFAAMREALGFVRRSPLLVTMLPLSLLMNFAIYGLLDVALPLLLKQQVGVVEGPRALGIVTGGFGLGSIVGAVAAGTASRLRRKTVAATVVLVPFAVLIGLVPLVEGSLPVAGVFAAMGLTLGFSNVLFMTIMQRFIPLEMMGRLMGVAMMGSFASAPLSIFAYGIAANLVPSIADLFYMGAGLMGIGSLIAVTRKVVWQTD